MQGKIVFEEQMAIKETVDHSKTFAVESGSWNEFAWRPETEQPDYAGAGEERIPLNSRPWYAMGKNGNPGSLFLTVPGRRL